MQEQLAGQQQAEAFVERSDPSHVPEEAGTTSHPGVAVGLPSMVRPGGSYPPRPASYAQETGTASVDGALRLGAALLGYGLPVFRVEEALFRLTSAMGVRVHSLGLPRALVVTVPGLVHERTAFVAAEDGVVDLDRLSSLHSLVGRVERSELSPEDVTQEVDRVLDAPAHYPAAAVVLGCALSAWGAACVLGGSLHDAHAAGLLGLGVGGLLMLSARHASLAMVQPLVAGLLAGALSMAAAAVYSLQPAVVVPASLLPLLPGLSITVAMMELGAGHTVCGTSRFAGAFTVLLQLVFGGLVGARLAGALAVPTQLPQGTQLPDWVLWGGALVMTSGIALLVQVRRTDFVWVLAICAVAFGSSRFASPAYGAAAGALISSALVGLLSNAFARRFDRPASVLQVPGILMLVPGCLGLASLSSLMTADPVGAVAGVGQVLLVATALSLGVLISTTILPARSSL